MPGAVQVPPPRPSAAPAASAWSGPARRAGWRRAPSDERRWRRRLWSILYPRRRQRNVPTLAGVLLSVLTFGIGVAAYNTSNNILFITLALLLSCLILSGLLSWLNFARVTWRLRLSPPWRVGQIAAVLVDVRNGKRLLPTYGLTFEVRSRSVPAGARLPLRARLDPAGGEASLEWSFRPTRRGREAVELAVVGSMFPFGFLRKTLTAGLRQEALVWPAPVEYQRILLPPAAQPSAGRPLARVGQNGDLLALRRYRQGDSHRLIHWKASARLRQLMVRQFAAEAQAVYSLWLDTPATLWVRPEQFELLCSFATSLAEDLFKAGRLASVAINAEAPQPVRRLRDLEAFFDRVAVLTPVDPPSSPGFAARVGAAPHRLTFAPDGTRGVAAYLDGHKAAAA